MSQLIWRNSQAFGGTQAALRWWKNSYGNQLPPRGFVWIVHGIGEHSGRYDEIANFLNQVGFDVLAPDLPGHGLTAAIGGQRRLPSVDEMVDELDAHFEHWITSGPLAARGLAHTPWYLMGHSMGALTALAWIIRGKKEGSDWEFARRAFISAPALKMMVKVPGWKKSLAGQLAKIAPDLKMRNGIDPHDISRDAAVVEAYRQDPLVHAYASPRLYFSMLESATRVQAGARDIEIPVLLSVGENDHIVDPRAVAEFYEHLGTHKKFLTWPGARHEILNELERQNLFNEVAAWFL